MLVAAVAVPVVAVAVEGHCWLGLEEVQGIAVSGAIGAVVAAGELVVLAMEMRELDSCWMQQLQADCWLTDAPPVEEVALEEAAHK